MSTTCVMFSFSLKALRHRYTMISFASMPNNCVTGAAFVPPLARPAWPTRSTRTGLLATAIRFKRRTPPGLSPAQMMQLDTTVGHTTFSWSIGSCYTEFRRDLRICTKTERRWYKLRCPCPITHLVRDACQERQTRIHTTRNCKPTCSRANLNIYDNIHQIK